MKKKQTPSERAKKDVSLPLTRAEVAEAKKEGSIMGYLKLPFGIPPQGSTKTVASSSSTAAAAAATTTMLAASVTGTKRNELPFGCQTGSTTKKKRRKKVNWEEHTDILQAYVDARNNQGNVSDTIAIIPPRTMVTDYVQRLADHKEATGENITVAEWIDQYKRKGERNPVISKDVHDRIQDIIVARDGRKNPMQQKEIIEIIQSVGGSTKKQAYNYY